MEFDAKTFAILIVFFGVLIGLLWDLFGDSNDWFDDFWEDVDWKDDEVDEDDRDQSRKK